MNNDEIIFWVKQHQLWDTRKSLSCTHITLFTAELTYLEALAFHVFSVAHALPEGNYTAILPVQVSL